MTVRSLKEGSPDCHVIMLLVLICSVSVFYHIWIYRCVCLHQVQICCSGGFQVFHQPDHLKQPAAWQEADWACAVAAVLALSTWWRRVQVLLMMSSSWWWWGVGAGPGRAGRWRFGPPGGALAPPGCAEEDTTDSTERHHRGRNGRKKEKNKKEKMWVNGWLNQKKWTKQQ